MENVYFACFLSVGNKLPVFPTVCSSEDLVVSLDQFCEWKEVGSLAQQYRAEIVECYSIWIAKQKKTRADIYRRALVLHLKFTLSSVSKI